MTLSAQDKQRLKEAWLKALDRSGPRADEPVPMPGIPNPPTTRQIVENTINSDIFYLSVEQDIRHGRNTISTWVEKIENMELPFGGGTRRLDG